MSSLTRDVRLVLCSPDGEVYGALPRFEVDTPWWMEVAPVIDGARQRYDIDLTIVRILETEDCWPPRGGAVSYLAEAVAPPDIPLEPTTVDMSEHPARMRPRSWPTKAR